MSSILCVIDLTDSSIKVLEIAGKVALGNKAALKILFPYRLIGYDSNDAAKLKSKLEAQAREKFESLIKKAKINAAVSWEFLPEIGFAGPRINYHISRSNIEMVIIGQHQADSLNEARGVSLSKFISASGLPFMIIPDELNVETVL